MKARIIASLVMMLLIAAAVLPEAGTMNNSKNQDEESTFESNGSQNQNPVIPDSNTGPIPRMLPP